MDAWATAADLARLYGVAKGTIYAWASQDHWRRTHHAWPKRYAWEDAQTSYEQRHAAAHVAQAPEVQARYGTVC
jgi:uncharacterized protein YjcR